MTKLEWKLDLKDTLTIDDDVLCVDPCNICNDSLNATIWSAIIHKMNKIDVDKKHSYLLTLNEGKKKLNILICTTEHGEDFYKISSGLEKDNQTIVCDSGMIAVCSFNDYRKFKCDEMEDNTYCVVLHHYGEFESKPKDSNLLSDLISIIPASNDEEVDEEIEVVEDGDSFRLFDDEE